jgi:hypothetical protein
MTQIETMIRVIDAWDSTTLTKNKDGRLWQMIEEMRQAIEEALAKQEQGEPDEEVLGFNGWGFPIQHHSKQKHDDPVVYSKEQMKIYAEANYDAGYTTGYMDASVKAHEAKQEQGKPVAWRNAAIRVGEDLCSVGPHGYYEMNAEQWLDWALSVVTVHAPPQPKREWVGLTYEDMEQLRDQFEDWNYPASLVSAIEAKLKEKNT